MEEKKKVIYVPKSTAKERTFKGTDGELVSVIAISFKAEDFYDFIAENTNEKGYINFDITKRKEVGTYGDTHSIVLNTYVKKEAVDGLPF